VATSHLEATVVALSRASALIPRFCIDEFQWASSSESLQEISDVLASLRRAIDQGDHDSGLDGVGHIRLLSNSLEAGVYTVPYQFLAACLERFSCICDELLEREAGLSKV
jgi:hypothetical protein